MKTALKILHFSTGCDMAGWLYPYLGTEAAWPTFDRLQVVVDERTYVQTARLIVEDMVDN